MLRMSSEWLLLFLNVQQPRSVLKMLNAQTKHSGHPDGKILSDHLLFAVVIVISLLDVVTSSTEV